MIRVLHFKKALTASRAGIECFILNLYEYIDKDQFEFIILTQAQKKDSELYREFVEKGIKIYEIKLPPLRLHTLRQYYKIFKNFYQKHSIDVVHVHNIDCPLLVPIAKMCGVSKVLVHTHTTKTETKLIFHGNRFKRFIEQSLLKIDIFSADDLFACSQTAGRNFFHKKAFTVIKNSIPIEQYAFDETKRLSVRSQYGLKEDEFAFCYVGRFAEVKNLNFLLQVFYEIHRILPQARLYIVGQGRENEEEKLRELVDQLKMEDYVFFTGSKKDVSTFLQGMDVYLQTSLSEGFSFSALEAQCAGLQTFISDGFPKEIGITDLVEIIPLSWNEKEWAKYVCEHIHRVDRSKYASIIQEEGYDSKQLAKYFESVYQVK